MAASNLRYSSIAEPFRASLPALFVDPAAHRFRPVARSAEMRWVIWKSLRIELKDRYAAEGVAVGIEKLVVVNVGVLAEDPFAVGPKIGLGGLALDAIAQLILPFVGVGKIQLVGEKEPAGHQDGSDHHWNDNAVEADASGLDGGDFIGALSAIRR